MESPEAGDPMTGQRQGPRKKHDIAGEAYWYWYYVDRIRVRLRGHIASDRAITICDFAKTR